MVVAVGVAIAWFIVGRREVPRAAPAKVSVVHPGGPRRPLRRRVQRGRSSCGPASTLTRAWSTFDNGVVDGAVNGPAAAIGGLVRPDPALAERLRPLLRPVRCSAAPRSSCSPSLVVNLAMNDFPWLTILIAAARPRSVRRGRCCCPARPAQRWPSRSRSASRCVDAGARRSPSRSSYDAGGGMPVRRDARLDPGVRRPLRRRRRRHRPGAGAAHRDPGAGRDPRLVERRRRRPLEREARSSPGCSCSRASRSASSPPPTSSCSTCLFEAMLIPIVLPDRRLRRRAAASYAAVKFLLYSLVGGLLMLAAVVGLYVVSAQTQGGPTYLVSRAGRSSTSAPSAGRWLFLGFFIAFAIKAPMWPVHTWLPDAAERGDARHLGAAGQRARQDRHLRDAALLPGAVPGGVAVGDPGGHRARGDQHHLRRAAGDRPERHHAADRLHLGLALRLHRAGHLRAQQPGPVRRDALHGQPRPLDRGAVPRRRLPDHAAAARR